MDRALSLNAIETNYCLRAVRKDIALLTPTLKFKQNRVVPRNWSFEFVKMNHFDTTDWELRLSNALEALAKVQDGFLRDYWETNGYPPQCSFNGKDETPFPSDDYYLVYNEALTAKRSDQRRYFKPLVEALAPVRSLLRIHPAFSSILKMVN